MSHPGGRRGAPSVPRWFTPLAVFVLALACYVPSASGFYANWDAYASSLSAWRIATTGQPWMDGVDFDALTGLRDPSVWQSEVDGHVVTTRMYGPILAAVPFYLGASPEETSFSIFRGGVAAATFVAAAVTLLFLAVRRHVGETTALVGVAVFAFATPAWSVAANALWTHPMTMFGLAGAAWATGRDRWWLAGAFLGVGMTARPHLGLVAAVLGLGLAWARRRPGIAVALAVPTVAALVLLGAWNRYVFGSWNPLGAYAGRAPAAAVSDLDEQINQVENVAGFLVSPDRGLFVWTPILLLMLPAVVRSWRGLPDWSRWLLTGGVAYSVLQLGLNYYGGADGFYGYRLALELLVCMTPAFILSIPAMGVWARRIAPLVVALQFAAIAPGALFETFYVSSYDVWVDNSFWSALRHHPAVIGGFTVLCLAVGGYASWRQVRAGGRRTPEPARPRAAPGTGRRR